MTTLEFLSHLRGKEIRVWIEDEKLRFRAPEAALTPELRAELAARKAEILQFLRQLKDESHAEMPPIRKAPRDKALPLSFSQQRLWFLDQLDPGVPNYIISDSTEIRKPVDIVILQRAITEVVRRHEILRTTFQSIDGVPMQVIAPPSEFKVPVIDLTSVPKSEQRAEAERFASKQAKAPFDLAKGPLLRINALRLQPDHYVCLFTIHHIILDDWSKKVLEQEIDTLYAAFSRGLPSPLPELEIQYADFAVWQREWLQGKVLDSHVNYWAEQLNGDLPTLQMPTDRPRSQSARGSTGKFTCSRAFTQAIKTLSDREGVTPFMTFIAAYAALLFRYTGQDDIIIGSPIADRNQPEAKNLIGFMLNTLPLRIRPSGDMTFRELLRQTREVCLGAHAHQEVPYETLLQRLHLNRDISATPLFQTMLVLLNTPAQSIDPNGLWGTKGSRDSHIAEDASGNGGVFKEDCHNGTTKFDLSFVIEEGQFFRGTTEYNTDLFDQETISRLVERLQILMQAAADHPTQRISELPLMTEVQRHELLAEWSGRRGPVARVQGVHQLFEAQAERTPQAIAVEIDGKCLTYAELNSRANQLARFIQGLGAGPETLVGIFLERSHEMLVAMLATLKTGAAYLPLDPSYPRQRLGFMLEDGHVNIVLTVQALSAELLQYTGCTVCVDTENSNIAAQQTENIPCQTWTESQVCVFYTSGSTGKPKGVAITHGALVNYTVSAVKAYGLKPEDRVLQFASMSFDASLEEIYPCISVGATLVLRTDQMMDSIAKFLSQCGDARITLLPLPTAYWHEIVAWQELKELKVEEMLPSVRLVIIGGERALPERLAVWQKSSNGQMVLVNTYGPTEGTIVVTRFKITGPMTEESSGKEVPIGWPIENAKVYVLDPWNQPVPGGIAGELHIGGEVLARGYLNRPDLTAEKFVPDPFSGQPGARLYKTGDLVRFLPDGSLEYRGRTDHQVKIRGYRIEPGEVEAAIEKHEAIKDVVVAVREDDPGLKRLVAYIVFRESVAVSPGDLRSFLKPKLPDYMLPAAFVFLQKMPMTASGKIDRQALPKPDRSRADVKGDLVAPRTPTEEIIASIWKTVLKLDRIGVHENFFELGGHSLLATQIVARISDALHIDLPLRRLFEALTIEELSAVVDKLIEAGASEKPRIVSVRRFLDAPTISQEMQSTNGSPSEFFQHIPAIPPPDPSMGQMLAGLEGLTDQEVNALLGEEDEIETSG